MGRFRAALSVAGPVVDGAAKLTNLPWRIERAGLERELSLEALVLINDFEAVGHALAQAGPGDFQHLCGSDSELPESGVISIIGPGTDVGTIAHWHSELPPNHPHLREHSAQGGHEQA